MEYQLKSDVITVSKNTGIDGFMYTIKTILKLKRVQSINIDTKGTIKYERYVTDAEDVVSIGVDYEGLEPYNVLRNSEIEELVTRLTNPLSVVANMFDMLSMEKLFPSAFVTGADTILHRWMAEGAGGVQLFRKSSILFGIPVLTDRNCPDTALILCGAYTRDAAVVDTQKAFKVEMDVESGPETNVEVI